MMNHYPLEPVPLHFHDNKCLIHISHSDVLIPLHFHDNVFTYIAFLDVFLCVNNSAEMVR